jgi:hypothetical protein
MAARSIIVWCSATAILCATLSLQGGATAAPTVAGNDVPTTESASSGDPAADLAARQLSKDYGISFDAALARIDDQPRIAALDLALGSDPNYAGLWVDQAHGGTVVVQSTAGQDQSLLDAAITDARLASPVERRTVDYSVQQLKAAEATIEAELPTVSTAQAPLSLSRSTTDDRISIDVVGSGVAGLLDATQALWYDSLLKRGLPIETDRAEAGRLEVGPCSLPFCDPPLRGGTVLAADSNLFATPYCTLGFNVQSQSDNKPYVLTAGHCGSTTWWEKFASDGTFHKVGTTWHVEHGYNTANDEQIITVDNPSGWHVPDNHVTVQACSCPGHPTTEDKYYYINNYTFPAEGTYTCHTGATWGTDCGKIYRNDTTFTAPGVITTHVIQTAGVGCEGDSGGPVYVNHAGQGIEIGGSGTSFEYPGWNETTVFCTAGYWYAVNMLNAANPLHVYPVGIATSP